MPDIRYGPDNPHPLPQLRTQLVWEGKYDEYGTRREVNVAGCAVPLQKIETINEPRRRPVAQATEQTQLLPPLRGGAALSSFRGQATGEPLGGAGLLSRPSDHRDSSVQHRHVHTWSSPVENVCRFITEPQRNTGTGDPDKWVSPVCGGKSSRFGLRWVENRSGRCLRDAEQPGPA
jgi:hypothetical protein